MDEENTHRIFATSGDGVTIDLGNDNKIDLSGQDILLLELVLVLEVTANMEC